MKKVFAMLCVVLMIAIAISVASCWQNTKGFNPKRLLAKATAPVNSTGAEVTIQFVLQGGTFTEAVMITEELPSKTLKANAKKQFAFDGNESLSIHSGDIDPRLIQAELHTTKKAIVTLNFKGRAKKLVVSASGYKGILWEQTHTVRLSTKEAKARKIVFDIDPVKGSIIKHKEVKK